jgi:O-antigen/teichoic acid export membrane protein
MAIVPLGSEEFDRDPTTVVTMPSKQNHRNKRVQRAAQIVMKFLFGQGATQSLTILANLFLVRTLSIEAYAQFGLAYGFQSVFSVLMDLGFASTIVPMVGPDRDDAALVGRYVRSARHLRNKLFWWLSPVATVAFAAIMHKHHWSMKVQILLLLSVLVGLYSAGKVSYFSAPLFVFGKLREYYLPQAVTGAGRLLMYIALFFAGGLSAWTAAGLSALVVTFNGFLIHKSSAKYFQWPDREDPETDRELIRYILPASPAIIFAAFQSQISLFLISIFGGTAYIAQVAALSRIAQIFTVLSMFFTIVVEPHVARVDRFHLRRTFLLFIALTSVACVPLVVIAFVWPKLYLWVLGAKYQDLASVMGIYVLSLCMNSVSGLMWIMNRSRKWVFWSGSIVEIVLLLGVQCLFLIFVGVNNTHEAVIFNLASSFCYLLAHGYVTVYGFNYAKNAPAESSAAE